jgi:ribosomal peptide maturation radical SAM protein 1
MPESIETTSGAERNSTGRPGDPIPEARPAERMAPGQRSSVHDQAIREFRVALVTMPFDACSRPSIQLGLLKAIGRRAGFPVDDYYLNLSLAAEFGFALYEVLQGSCHDNYMGDWLFSTAAFREESCREDFVSAFLGDFQGPMSIMGKDAAFFNDLRARVLPEFIEECILRNDWGSYRAVGFTSTFQQHVASLALARRIKEQFPHVVTIFGGATMDGDMGAEYLRAFPFIDYGVSGDGDEVFPALLTCLALERDPGDMPGLIARRGDGVSFSGSADPVRDLDNLPVPDYNTYYEAAWRYEIGKALETVPRQMSKWEMGAVPIESSRGCWWGAKSQCTFCGLNSHGIGFRSKSSERMLAEFDELSRRYSAKRFFVCDNAMDLKYIDEIFRPLGERSERYEIGWEAKANMTREQVRALAKGGMALMQPGVESLSPHILKLMRKGVSKLQNVNLLRWCTYYGMSLYWNLLHGFPGESPEDYAEELETLRLIPFVWPPNSCMRIWLERCSPYFQDRGLFPTKWRRPRSALYYVYPERLNLEQASNYFDYELDCDAVPEEAYQEMIRYVLGWRADWFFGRRATLTYRIVDSDIVIEDGRPGWSGPRSLRLSGMEARIYEDLISAPQSPAQVRARLEAQCPESAPDDDGIAEACDELCEAGLMIREGNKYLSLALPAEPDL